MLTIMNRVKLLVPVFKGDCVVITKKDNKVKVDAGTKSKEDVKNIATAFFKEAYKLK
jgi:hypothetical protein